MVLSHIVWVPTSIIYHEGHEEHEGKNSDRLKPMRQIKYGFIPVKV